MADGKYFATTKKGEMAELRQDLHSENRTKKKEAVKKVIASMTVGKDVSSLFTDVINCMQTDNLELKKLVYLYLMNYAKSQPDMAILAVNTFVKDCEDSNPLIRALAVRTMGCIRVDKITEYLCEPLRKCLKDDDPYVRKTAAVCVAKLFDINQNMVKEQGFLDSLHELLTDSNPMVVANAVAALAEIGEVSGNFHDYINDESVNKLLTALNECTEWGQIFILDALAQYTPKDAAEAQRTCERITPRLQHANAAVVLSAIKVLMRYDTLIHDEEYQQGLYRKLAPPLVTLLSHEPEVQYVALRNINLVVQKMPEILRHEIKVFFVKYNDPIYVKLEKLDILIRLASQSNITQVLSELKEYSQEVDVDFVRKSVRAIGRCAIKVEGQSEKCVQTLLELIKTKVNYVVQEAIVVIKDIFRKYPDRYESIINNLCENLSSLDEPEARAAMIWIVGEYADRIDNAAELLSRFLDVFHDAAPQTQLQLITAIVKMFLKKPAETQELVQKALSLATMDSDNPDLRDRGYIYWRLLSTDPAAAREVVLAERPLIAEETDLLEPQLLNQLINHISSLASVYHRPPNTFLEAGIGRGLGVDSNSSEVANVNVEGKSSDAPRVIPSMDNGGGDMMNSNITDLIDVSFCSEATEPVVENVANDGVNSILDLIGGLDVGSNTPPVQNNNMIGNLISEPISAPQNNDPLQDLFGTSLSSAPISTPPTQKYKPQYEMWLNGKDGKGLQVEGTFSLDSGEIYVHLKMANQILGDLSGFALQFNKNSFGITLAEPLIVNQPVSPNSSIDVKVRLATTGQIVKSTPINNIQVAVKNNIGVSFWACKMPIHIFFSSTGKMEPSVFINTWKELPSNCEQSFSLEGWGSTDAANEKLTLNNVFIVSKRTVEGQEYHYYSVQLVNKLWILAEVAVPNKLTVKTKAVEICECFHTVFQGIVKT